jgi:hypothetical protein
MSLLEVILAIAVAGFVLAAAVSMLVSISIIWAERAERHFFVDHIDGVTEFLNATFSTAGLKIATDDGNNDSQAEDSTNGDLEDNESPTASPRISVPTSSQSSSNTDSSSSSLIHTDDEPIRWAHPPGFSENKDPLLHFELPKAPPLLVGLENAPLLGLNVFLYFDQNEGLSLLWYSKLQEETEATSDLRRTLISSLVTAIDYIYWDERFDKWETEDTPKEGDGIDQYLLPRFIKLTFEYEGVTQERTFAIPVPIKSALIY